MSGGDNESRLIDLVQKWRDEECLRLLDRARDEALDLLHKAYRRARRQLHRAAQAERGGVRRHLAAARAELETQRRLHRQQLGAVLLETARGRLPQRLAEQWDDPASRAAWIANAVTQALERLPAGRWRVYHASRFLAGDHDVLLHALLPRRHEAPELVADPALKAGLIIESGNVRLDASIGGLLADTGAIEARLLALLEEGEPS